MLIQIVMAITPAVFAPSELLAPDFLYVVHRGVALFAGKIFTRSHVWGEVLLLTTDYLPLTTYYLLLTTDYLLLATYYLALTTDY